MLCKVIMTVDFHQNNTNTQDDYRTRHLRNELRRKNFEPSRGIITLEIII